MTEAKRFSVEESREKREEKKRKGRIYKRQHGTGVLRQPVDSMIVVRGARDVKAQLRGQIIEKGKDQRQSAGEERSKAKSGVGKNGRKVGDKWDQKTDVEGVQKNVRTEKYNAKIRKRKQTT